MCNDNDLEGVRLWFYGGTPPLDDTGADEHATPAACAWPLTPHGQAAADTTRDQPRELATA